MKKLTSIILSAVLLLALAACGGKGGGDGEGRAGSEPVL